MNTNPCIILGSSGPMFFSEKDEQLCYSHRTGRDKTQVYGISKAKQIIKATVKKRTSWGFECSKEEYRIFEISKLYI